MAAETFDNRDGWIWMDGHLVEWRDAKVHVLTHALHYASAVFEGERAYGGRIFKSADHSRRLRESARILDFEVPWSVAEIDAAKAEVLKRNRLADAYVRAIALDPRYASAHLNLANIFQRAGDSARALASFTDIFWIAGGRAKTGGITPLAGFFPRIRKAYLVGEAAEDFATTLQGQVPYAVAGTLDLAVALAASDASASGLAEPVVLLSPACASFDQYPNFEVRGSAFRDLVLGLPGVRPMAAA